MTYSEPTRPDSSPQRQLIRPLLAPTAPEDALTAYYALTYNPKRVKLTVFRTSEGAAEGFVAVCRTGQDLFTPLVVLRAPLHRISTVLQQTLHLGRPYKVITKPAYRETIQETMQVDREQVNDIFVLDATSFRPVINVMVQPGQEPFRFEIRSANQVMAAAGANWHTDTMAEIYVYASEQVRGRGWGRAVAAACVHALLEAGLLPLYTVSRENASSVRLAHALGFRDSDAREFDCQGRLSEK